MIDPNKTYQTRDGHAVRIYATDGVDPYPVHGAFYSHDNEGWDPDTWTEDGKFLVDTFDSLDLVEVTLTDQIPWSAIRPEIQWASMDGDGTWWGYEAEPETLNHFERFGLQQRVCYNLDGVNNMPQVPTDRWRETLTRRPS